MGLLATVESFGKAAWEAGKDVVDVVSDVKAVADGAQAVGDFIARIGVRADIVKVVEVGEKLAGWAERVGLYRVLRAADSAILDGGQLVIAGMRLTTGMGSPEAGERFGTGSARFREAAATLGSAEPSDDWSGEASRTYAGRNSKQKAGAEELAHADHEVQRVLATEAYQVRFHRDRLDEWSNWLADVGLVTFGIGLIPGYGKAAKEAAELAAVMTAVGSSSLELHALSSEVDTNCADLGRLLRSYEDVSTGSVGSEPHPPEPPPPSPPAPVGGPISPTKPDLPPEPISPDAPPQAPWDQPAAPAGSQSGGSRSGTRGGGGSAPAASPPRQRVVAAAPTPPPAGASRGPGPAAMGAAPAGPGAVPAAPPAAASSIPAALINQVQAAVHAAVEKALEQADERREREQEQARERDEDGEGEPDESPRDEQDGGDTPPTDAADETDASPAPVGPANVSDPASPDRSIAATLDREKFNRADAGTSTMGR